MDAVHSMLKRDIGNSVGFNDLNLTKNADMATIVRAMAQPDSGLEVRDRMWLKIRIPHSFIGMASLNSGCCYSCVVICDYNTATQ